MEEPMNHCILAVACALLFSVAAQANIENNDPPNDLPTEQGKLFSCVSEEYFDFEPAYPQVHVLLLRASGFLHARTFVKMNADEMTQIGETGILQQSFIGDRYITYDRDREFQLEVNTNGRSTLGCGSNPRNADCAGQVQARVGSNPAMIFDLQCAEGRE